MRFLYYFPYPFPVFKFRFVSERVSVGGKRDATQGGLVEKRERA